jgi:uncharacterized membrane protein
LRGKAYIAILLTMLIAVIPLAEGQEQYTPIELSFIVFPDGYVAIDYYVDVDPTKARVNVSLFGNLYLDIFVEDQDGLPLDYSSSSDGLTVDTLGSASVLISYVTADLTGKAGTTWTFKASTLINATILLPDGSTILSLNMVPRAMGSIDGGLLITMPPGDLEIAYTIGIVGTREHAIVVIRDAEAKIGEIKAEGIIVDEAESLLQQAYDALNSELYAEAEQLANQAKAEARTSQEAASSAKDAIDAASASIAAASEAGRTVGLDDAEGLLQQAEAEYEAGDYSGAKTLAGEAQTAADRAETPKRRGIPYTWLAAGLGGAAVFIYVAFFLRKRAPEAVEIKASYDIETLFEEHPYMRLDDKEVIRFIAAAGGETFAAEIRDRFDVPRTSLWRMIRRLEGEGIVEVETIGGQSLVRISDKYRAGGAQG